ncbi:MAG: hypothetical protein GY910_09830 [bacterium]|nr:hypothetical protein [Deltaproteobacteria bacterium]MCP4905267.1 hypothetical protein [bacterium]
MFRVWGSGLIAAGLVLFAGVSFAQDDCGTDFNGDGITDVADIEVLQAALGSLEGDDDYVAAADLDGDGEVTVADYGIMLSCN